MEAEDVFAGRHLERLRESIEPKSKRQSNAPPVSMHPHDRQNFGRMKEQRGEEMCRSASQSNRGSRRKRESGMGFLVSARRFDSTSDIDRFSKGRVCYFPRNVS